MSKELSILIANFLITYRNISAIDYAELLSARLREKHLLDDNISKVLLETLEEFSKNTIIQENDNNDFKNFN